MEPCEIEYRQIPGLGYQAWWCVDHDNDPIHYDTDIGGWVCQTYVIGKRKESHSRDAAMRVLEALSEALEEERGTHYYASNYALVDDPLRAVKGAVDRAISTLKKESDG